MRRLIGGGGRAGCRVRGFGRMPSRIALCGLVAAIAALGGATLLSASLLDHYLKAQLDREIEKARALPLPASPPADRLPVDPECVVLLVDSRGRITERRVGSPTLPSFPPLPVDRLNTYASGGHPVAVGPGGEYHALVVRDGTQGGYRVIARSTAGTERAVARLFQLQGALGAILLAAVVAGARRMNLREARDRKEWERQLREFVAISGHELRNQLTTIAGYAELAGVAGETERHRQTRATALGRVAVEIRRMTAFVDELALVQRLHLGGPLRREQVDLAQLCGDVVSAARACHPGHAVRLLIGPGDHTVLGDPQWLHQLVDNLLTNVRRHTPPGTTTTLGLGTEDGYRVIEVADDGPGVPPALRDTVFDRFVRAEGTTTAGSGLGLSVVAAVATAHGGRVTLEPSRRGAWFRVRLPAAPGKRGATAVPHKPVGNSPADDEV